MRRASVTRTGLISTITLLWSSVWQLACADLQDSIEEILVEEGLTGVAWMLVGETTEIRVGDAGFRDNLTEVAFTPETRFHVGSLTKTLVATGVLRLATEGRISLDAPAIHYLPNLFSGTPPANFSEVTVRHLLDHTAGLNDANLWQMFSERAAADDPLLAAFPDPDVQLQIRSEPGSRFSYSNTGYTLLGMIIESVVGDRYEAYLDEQVLGPLAMHDSTFEFTTQIGKGADPTLAWGHVDDGSRYAASPLFLRPAGQLTTTTADLARFAKFLLGNGIFEGQTFVDESLMRSRGRPIGTEAADVGLDAGYALGVARRDRHGVVAYCHGGNVVGFVAMLCIFPDEHKAFAYSVNTDSETADYGRLDRFFVETLKIAGAPPPRTAAPSFDISKWYGRYILSPNRFQMFEYLDIVFGAVKVSADEGALLLTSMQKGARQLRPVGGLLYSAGDRTTTSHVFFRGKDGEYLMSDGFQTLEKVSTLYLAAHWLSISLGIAGLGWLLIAGSISLLRYRSALFRRPEAPAFVAVILLIAPAPFFATQSFMALGDFTPASALLAIVTLLLPIGALSTTLLAMKEWRTSRINLLHGAAAIFVLQWCVVLGATGMLPLRLWA